MPLRKINSAPTVKRIHLLETLPKSIKSLALIRIAESIAFWSSKNVEISMDEALNLNVDRAAGLKGPCTQGYFKFSQTPEGFSFWDKVNNIYFLQK